MHFRELAPNHRARTVHGIVVDHKHLRCIARLFQHRNTRPHREQALGKKVFNVVIDNDDRNVHGLKLGGIR